MSDPTYPLFPIFAFLGFIVGLIPLPWHLQAWNSGTCMFMLWSSLSCLIQFVNSVVWHGNVRDTAPVWCDIATKFTIGAGVGIPASSLCINRRLYRIAAIRNVSITKEEKKKTVIIDLSITIGLPVLVMILHYIVQGHRFNILEDVGCLPEIFNTPPAYPLVFMWPVLIGCVSFVYAILTLHAFWKRRIQFSELLSTATSMTVNRYFRLMLLSCLEILLTVPLSSFSIYINNYGLTLSPWISWEDTHFNFSHVEHITGAIWRSSRPYYVSVEMSRWIYPFSAFLFFALFGFAEEARRNYIRAFWWIANLVGIRRPSESPKSNGFIGYVCSATSSLLHVG
ncbi:fungal pheromone STE3G-protein-coupled receptor [Panus rudis PR-1116 ss-1]|nr:fungal pheromone STE3G-protein-coupled receptor [Panus rudis PR-1116 ss-1]